MKPRHVLWTQLGLLAYSVGAKRLLGSGLIDIWTTGAEGTTYTTLAHTIGGIYALSMICSCWIFPLVILKLVPWLKRPREAVICLIAECALWLGNGFVLTVECSHY
jgi:hypothetical protein